MRDDLIDDLLVLATPAELLEAAAEIVAGEFPTPDAYPGPCANCGCPPHSMKGDHRRGFCPGGLDPCMVRCQAYVRPERLEAKGLRRMAAVLRDREATHA